MARRVNGGRLLDLEVVPPQPARHGRNLLEVPGAGLLPLLGGVVGLELADRVRVDPDMLDPEWVQHVPHRTVAKSNPLL
jgi:hypothetical protein